MISVNNTTRIKVIVGAQRHRRRTPEQKIELIKLTFATGISVSMIARQAGIPAPYFANGRRHAQRALWWSLMPANWGTSV